MPQIDIADHVTWNESFPHPNWESIQPLLDGLDAAEQVAARDEVVRQWLDKLAEVFPGCYQVAESDHHLLLCLDGFPHRAVLQLARQCRAFMLHTLPGICPSPHKVPILIWHDQETYYHYLARFYPDGDHGGSAGVHIRAECQHVVLWGKDLNSVDSIIAHELTHAGLGLAELPLWVEEGLAQIVEHDIAGRQLLELTSKMGALQKRYWHRFSLQSFWDGTAFVQASRSSQLAYQLAEVLVRLLLAEAQPSWFGLVRGQQSKLVSFLTAANASDAGEAAAHEHLGISLADLAARFLGPGDWDPQPIESPKPDLPASNPQEVE